MTSKLKLFTFILIGIFGRLASAGSFYIGLPLGAEGVKSSDVNPSLASEGLPTITDLSNSSYGAGFGYEWDSGFRLGVKGGQTQVLDHSTGTVFANYSITRGGLNLEAPVLGGSMTFVDLGFTLGAGQSRYTIIGAAQTGVAQKIDAYLEPSLSFKYGGKSTKFFIDASFPILAAGEFKAFGNSGVSSLAGPGPALILGFLIYL